MITGISNHSGDIQPKTEAIISTMTVLVFSISYSQLASIEIDSQYQRPDHFTFREYVVKSKRGCYCLLTWW
ncbi:MAG: hypothetical protein CR997_08760 [Acidobacteria bacterium]|nr:MAG: hypothetical protein CR997_08760 [Acidobacteriota bacterium]